MKKINILVSVIICFVFFPTVSFAGINKLNGLNDSQQFLATTTGSTSMHMKIGTVGTDTHQFQWDSTPWNVNQGGTGNTSFTNGSILFYSNSFSQNNSNFFWDFINNTLSIGTNSTSTVSKFTVKGAVGQILLNILSSSGASKLFVAENGNVGINNSSPKHALDVSGAMYSRLVTAGSNIDWNTGNVQSLTLTNSQTLTFINAEAGGEYKLILKQDGTGGRVVVWPGSVKWPSGNAPTITTIANGIDVISFVYDGANYLGSYTLNYLISAPLPLLTDSLVSYWKLDESSGNASDSVGSNTLTNNNTVSYSVGLINNAADFGSSNNDKDFSTNSNLGITGGPVSVSLWVKLDTEISSGAYTFFDSEDAITFNGYYILYEYNGGTRRLVFRRQRQNVANDDSIFTIALGTSSWHHVVLTYDGSNVRGYVDNVASTPTASSGDGSGGYTTSRSFVGSQTGTASYASTQIDEIGLWSRSLSAFEVAQLYNSGNGLQYPF